MILDNKLLDRVTEQAKNNDRLRMNFNLHESLDSKAQKLFNALEPGTLLPIHRHPSTSETYIVIRGGIKVIFYNNDREVTETFDLDPLKGNYGVNIPANQWHTLEVLTSGTVIFEVKDGPYTPLSPDNLME